MQDTIIERARKGERVSRSTVIKARRLAMPSFSEDEPKGGVVRVIADERDEPAPVLQITSHDMHLATLRSCQREVESLQHRLRTACPPAVDKLQQVHDVLGAEIEARERKGTAH